MTLWFGTGADFNFLTRAKNITLSPDAADAAFPLAGLSDGRTGVECRHAAIGSGEQIQVDLQHVVNGDFESGFTTNVPNNWVKVGAGSTADDAVNFHGGAHAVQLDASGGSVYIRQAVTAVPGEQWQITAWAKRLTGAQTLGLYVLNRQTGRYWNGSIWTTTRSSFATTTSAIYVQIGATPFTVEDALTCGNLPNVELEIQTELTSGVSTGVFDDVEACPLVNFVGVFGHNIDPLIAPTWSSSPDATSWTTRATLDPKYRPAFYALLQSPIAARHWRVTNTGTNSTRSGAISYGEVVLSQLVQALRDFKPPLRVSWAEMQQRDFGSTGAQWAYALSGGPIRTAAIAFDLAGSWPSTQYIQLRDKLFRLSRNGFYPWVVVIRDADPESCIFGRPPDAVTYEAPVLSWTQINGITIVEDAMPTRVG